MKTPVFESPEGQQIYQKEIPTQVLSCEICEILRKLFLQNISGDCFVPSFSPFSPLERLIEKINPKISDAIMCLNSNLKTQIV